MSWSKDAGRIGRRRAVLWELQRGRCYLCGKKMRRVRHTRPEVASDDHVMPKRLGGTRLNNILLAHRRCNLAKADRAPHPCEQLFAAIIYERIAA